MAPIEDLTMGITLTIGFLECLHCHISFLLVSFICVCCFNHYYRFFISHFTIVGVILILTTIQRTKNNYPLTHHLSPLFYFWWPTVCWDTSIKSKIKCYLYILYSCWLPHRPILCFKYSFFIHLHLKDNLKYEGNLFFFFINTLPTTFFINSLLMKIIVCFYTIDNHLRHDNFFKPTRGREGIHSLTITHNHVLMLICKFVNFHY